MYLRACTRTQLYSQSVRYEAVPSVYFVLTKTPPTPTFYSICPSVTLQGFFFFLHLVLCPSLLQIFLFTSPFSLSPLSLSSRCCDSESQAQDRVVPSGPAVGHWDSRCGTWFRNKRFVLQLNNRDNLPGSSIRLRDWTGTGVWSQGRTWG